MGGVFQDPTGQWLVWCSLFFAKTQNRLVSESVPQGDITINNLELAAFLVQHHLLAPRVIPLFHIRTVIDNTASQGWANRGRVISSCAVGAILRELALLTRQWRLYASIGQV